MLATTYGTGQLMKAALDAGIKRMIVGMGGSGDGDGEWDPDRLVQLPACGVWVQPPVMESIGQAWPCLVPDFRGGRWR